MMTVTRNERTRRKCQLCIWLMPTRECGAANYDEGLFDAEERAGARAFRRGARRDCPCFSSRQKYGDHIGYAVEAMREIARRPPMQVKQTSKYRYVARRGREIREFSDEDYKHWLNEQTCAVCGKQPSQAHHMPPVGNSGRDHAVYWKCALPLCILCHRSYHDQGFDKRVMADLRVLPRKRYPLRFITERFKTVGG